MWDKPDSLIPNWKDLKLSDCSNVVCDDVVIISKTYLKRSGERCQPLFYFFLKKIFISEERSFLASAKSSLVWVVKKIFTIFGIKVTDFSVISFCFLLCASENKGSFYILAHNNNLFPKVFLLSWGQRYMLEISSILHFLYRL